MGLDIGQTHPYLLRVCFTTAPFKHHEYILRASSLLLKEKLCRQILLSFQNLQLLHKHVINCVFLIIMRICWKNLPSLLPYSGINLLCIVLCIFLHYICFIHSSSLYYFSITSQSLAFTENDERLNNEREGNTKTGVKRIKFKCSVLLIMSVLMLIIDSGYFPIHSELPAVICKITTEKLTIEIGLQFPTPYHLFYIQHMFSLFTK